VEILLRGLVCLATRAARSRRGSMDGLRVQAEGLRTETDSDVNEMDSDVNEADSDVSGVFDAARRQCFGGGLPGVRL